MNTKAGHFIYFTTSDEKLLKGLSEKRNESKSSVVRKLIRIEKYAKTLEEIENHNRVLANLLKEFGKIGVNINQIAYHINAHMTTEQQAQSELNTQIAQLKTLEQNIEEVLKELNTVFSIRTHKKMKNQEKEEDYGTDITEIFC